MPACKERMLKYGCLEQMLAYLLIGILGSKYTSLASLSPLEMNPFPLVKVINPQA
jgi:hypothetical protein